MELEVSFAETGRNMSVSFGDAQVVSVDDSKVGRLPWSSKNTVDKLCPAFIESGSKVRCEPVEGYPLTVTAEDGATTITRCGKNLIDYTKAEGRDASFIINIIENGVEWVAGAYYFIIPCDIKAGETVIFSCVYTQEAMSNTVLYNRDTKKECSSNRAYGKPLTATADANALLVYRKNGNTEITTPIEITNLQLEFGSVATAYEPYKVIETFTPGETVPALSGVNIIWADSGEITVTGKSDPVAIINKLTNAIISLGSNL